MNLFQLVKRNVVSGFSTYFVYFASVAVNVMMYFIFASLKYNGQVMAFSEGSAKAGGGFSVASVVIMLFALVFIAYSSSYFIRRRKKEIGLYSLMGITKRQIGTMLFYENLLTGGLALAVGLALGAVFSRLFTLLLLRFMGYSSAVKMTLSARGMGETIVVFGVIFIGVSIISTSIAHRFSLAELFVGGRKAEEEPKPRAWKAAIAVIALTACYVKACLSGERTILMDMPICVVLAVVGTYTFFSSFVVNAIRAQRTNKSRYYRGLRMFGVSQLIYRLSSNSRTLATIVILVATALTSMSVGAGVYRYMEDMMDKNEPFSFVISSWDKSLDADIRRIIAKYPKNSLKGSATAEFIRLPTMYEELAGRARPNRNRPTMFDSYLTSESMQNRLDKAKGGRGRIRLSVAHSGGVRSAAVAMPAWSAFDTRDVHGRVLTIRLKGKPGREGPYQRVAITQERSLASVNMLSWAAVLVVEDAVYNKFRRAADHKDTLRFRVYEVAHEKDSEGVSKAVAAAMPKGRNEFSSFFLDNKSSIVAQAMMLFIGLFLGMVFIISTGSIIYFKQLSEAQEDAAKYKTLRQLGVHEGAISRSIFRELGFFFTIPLVLAGLHTAFAMYALNKLLLTLSVVPLLYTYGAFLGIYGVFYVLTVKGYQAAVAAK